MSPRQHRRRAAASGRRREERPDARAGVAVSGPSGAGPTAVVPGSAMVLAGREESMDLREEAADLREEAAVAREAAAVQREEVATARERLLRPREREARDQDAQGVLTEQQLRDANERLVVATVAAQTMTEAAERASQQMSHMATHDILTGLPNRAVLLDRLAQSIALARRHGERVALLFIDLDHFKGINDALGHSVGDELLQSTARRLQACVRLSDTVSRQGGDEFVVLLPQVDDARGAAHTAEKLIESMAQPHLIGGHRLLVTLSIGISIYPDDGEDVETIFRNADTAMYHAKKRGRNILQVFTEDMNLRAVARRSVEAALHRALDHRGLVLHFQPQVALETGGVVGAEALVRMLHVDDQLVYPAQFVSVAEESGLILPLGRWVLREACRQTQAWLERGLDLGRIAVNVSAKELHGRDFLAGVRSILSDTGLDPRRLELELTETGLMQDTDRSTPVLLALKDLGVQIAIDDFGTGFSSLSYLQRLPVDTLKIDQSFVQDVDSHAGEAIVSAIIALGLSLKQRVVAEGIETQHQITFLRAHRCSQGQGHFFSRPLTADTFAANW